MRKNNLYFLNQNYQELKSDLFSSFNAGVNIGGFDMGSGCPKQGGYACISKDVIDFAYKSGLKLLRFPIFPCRVFKNTDVFDVENLDYDETKFNEQFIGTTQCGDSAWNTGSYIPAIKYALSKGMKVIIDLHNNMPNPRQGLKIGSKNITSMQYINFWNFISKYIKINIKSDDIIFELFNEPTGGLVTDQNYYDTHFQIPTIKKIKENTPNNYILVTTYGNYSGVHFWNDDKTLEYLVQNLKKNSYTSSSKDKILIAGHQYCDKDYSGRSKNCDTTNFSKSNRNKWLNYIESVFSDNQVDFKWIQTEGNVVCNPDCENANLYMEWLKQLQDSNTCIGYTLWLFVNKNINQPKIENGAVFGNNEIQIDTYNKIYSTKDSYYQFPYGKPVPSPSPPVPSPSPPVPSPSPPVPSPSPSPPSPSPSPSPSNKCPYGSFKSCFEKTSSIEHIPCNVAYDTCENRCDDPHESMYKLCHESHHEPGCPGGSFKSCFNETHIGKVPCKEAYNDCKEICQGPYESLSELCPPCPNPPCPSPPGPPGPTPGSPSHNTIFIIIVIIILIILFLILSIFYIYNK